jgi:hypothetical protein
MVTRFALWQLRSVIVGFPISAPVSKLFTVPTRGLPSTTVRGEEASDGFRRGERVGGGPDDRLGLSRLERRWRSIVGDDWPQLRMSLADVAIGSVSNR